MNSQRYQSGLNKLKEIDGEAGEKVIASLASIAPDLAKYTIEFPFGEDIPVTIQYAKFSKF